MVSSKKDRRTIKAKRIIIAAVHIKKNKVQNVVNFLFYFTSCQFTSLGQLRVSGSVVSPGTGIVW